MMKKLFLLLFSVVLIYACKKNNNPPPQQESVTGTLRYSDPASDGLGLYYQTDSSEILIIKDDTPNLTSLNPKYSDFVNEHSRLTYTYDGERGCLSAMVPGPCTNPLRKVVVIKLENL